MVRPMAKRESGQATLEYVLLLTIVVSFFMIVSQGLERLGLADKLLKPITQDFAYAYKYGHPDARGYDEGDPKMHPRIDTKGNFRIFINPSPNR